MPRTIKADGRTITVPDDATPDEINQIVGPPPTAKPKGFWESYDEKVAPLVTLYPHNLRSLLPGKNGQVDPSAYLKEGATALSNIGAAGLGVLLHPVNTVGGILKTAVRSLPPVVFAENLMTGTDVNKEMAEQFVKAPLETAETMVGQAGAMGAAGEVAGGVARVVPNTAGELLRGATKTGPRETANLVKETQATNEGIRQSNAEGAQVHLDKTIDALHQTRGNELQYQQALKAAHDAADEAQRTLDAEHSEAVQKGLQETREKEDLYQQELRKAKSESEDAYRQKLAEVEEKRAKAEQTRRQELHQYYLKKAKVQSELAGDRASQARKEALSRGVEELDPRVHDELVQTEKTVNAQANEKYTALRKVLKNEKSGMYQPKDDEGHLQGAPVSVPQRLFDAADESMRGSDTAPTIIKDIGKRVQQGETSLSYDDLQGYREEIGRELRKGTLPPDVYNAYKKMMPMIDDAMQEIADRHGLGKAQTDARSFYREYAQTFLDRDSPVRAAIDTGKSIGRKPGSVVNALQGRNTAVEALARYNPELARKLNTIRGYQTEARGISARLKPGRLLPKLEPKPAAIPNPEPIAPKEVAPPPRVELPNRPESVQPKLPKQPERAAPPDRPAEEPIKTIGPEDVREAKRKSLAKKEEHARTGYSPLLTSLSVFDAFRNAIEGNWKAVGVDIAARGAYEIGKQGFAALLRNPKVIEVLTRPTAADIAQVPADLRGPGLSRIIQEAQKQGIKVNPQWYAVAGAVAPKKTPGDLLRQAQ